MRESRVINVTAVRLIQGDFSSCENVARGLRFAGARVAVFSCNRAGDIVNADWTTSDDDSPFSESMRYARMIGNVL
jgi:hypothetical protein